ncbi:protein-lysine N-methyltransferase Efm5p [[Candida] anglica]|uniref:Protein-lysine N-methyltransferase EFM5 n=1 Tax=[Candida] anglica TaxID=148631 RepID=A0ABP0E7L5_9ASCO
MDSDDELSLSSHALAALQEFKKEEEERIKHFNDLKAIAEADDAKKKEITIHEFQEDWQLSQFWYADETAATLGHALLAGADEDTVIVIASAPSVYAAIQKFPEEEIPTKHIYLFEYDKRFEVLAGSDHFYFYDFNSPDNIPEKLKHECDRLLIDPPFLSEDCQTKSARAARNLLTTDKTSKTASGDLKFKLLSCTGERMKGVIRKAYPETRITDYLPSHHNGLQNEFRCYASFESASWKFLPESEQVNADDEI